MAADLLFTDEEMAVDEGLGYPKTYAKICRDRSVSPYSHGPPFTFTPYALQQHEASRAREFDEMFPILDPKAKPSAKPRIFVSLLWKQLNHLGNAGFDPAIFRVDTYGNVIYFHADSASPLAWDIDHWFPCSRGGLTVPSNLRILQWQVCKKKHNKLEFLIPWWDLQLGISINQFLSIFTSSNSDFRHRAFSLLFSEGESEEINASQTVDSHVFPQHFIESKEKVGLAPAAIVLSRRESYDASSVLISLDINRRPRSNFPIIDARKLKTSVLKENENPDMVANPYQAIVTARDSLRQREETAKVQGEIQKLDDELNELKQKTEDEKVSIQELELVLIKRRRRAEKCRRLAEAQSSYRVMLEKMIRDAMHQSVIYKEQVRLNQAATNALMARLEAQKAICDSSEKELHRKFKQREELEKQVKPEGEHMRKRSRMDDLGFGEKNDDRTLIYLPVNTPRAHVEKEIDDVLMEKGNDRTVLYLPGIKSTPLHKELRVFLAEEQKASEAALSLNEERKQEEIEELTNDITKEIPKYEFRIEDKLQTLKIGEERAEIYNVRFPVPRELEREEEDEESRRQRGKGNIEKWLQMLLENTPESTDTDPQNVNDNENSRTDEIIKKLNLKYAQQGIEGMEIQESQETVQKKDGERSEEEERVRIEERSMLIKNPPYKLPKKESRANEAGIVGKVGEESRSSFEGQEKERKGKEKGLVRSESARAFRRIPSSPSLIMGMRKGVDCIRKKPSVIGDDDCDENDAGNNFIKSSIKTIKKAVKI
ncbi:Myosin-10 like [Actinidia chinensis var. chinensis]|uniref:Myosin-10 like n=1 Tax=Actinidia chinensis var. chinensis TaxID=1590841 RepID=A0A2R6PSN7_ACTCC|nr:Myosin-10 like [Actinidia chinensis var. chinensis]